MYKQVIFEEGSWGRWVQKKFQKYIGFAPCIFHGRGLFSPNTWGLVPYSKPITTVGEPQPTALGCHSAGCLALEPCSQPGGLRCVLSVRVLVGVSGVGWGGAKGLCWESHCDR